LGGGRTTPNRAQGERDANGGRPTAECQHQKERQEGEKEGFLNFVGNSFSTYLFHRFYFTKNKNKKQNKTKIELGAEQDNTK
jgi:hypothetical protein